MTEKSNDGCDNHEKSKSKSEKRAQKMIELLDASKGVELSKLPVPPITQWLNGKIVEAKRGEVKVQYLVRPEMANPTQLLHGGMHCAFMDDAIGITTATLGYEGFLITIDFHIDYLGKVAVGESVIAHAKIIREGKNIVNAEASLWDLNGNMVSTAKANLLITGHEPDFNKLVK